MENERLSVIMIGNSHIDPVWLWRDREGLQEVKATFASALARMEEFPEFEFTASSAAFYAWLEQYCPDVFAKVRERVLEGRWHLAGGWWVEPDMNLPGGESLVRQGLYGQRYFRAAFGKMASVGYLPDSFGHGAGLPKVLRGQGLSSYIFMRPMPGQLEVPPLFHWLDEDGSRVIGVRIQGEYCAWTRTAIVDNLEKALAAMREHGLCEMPVFYGVGNHGGGPTIENIKAIRELKQERPELRMENGSLEAFFESLGERELPALEGELEGCFPGCFSADGELKRLNRLAEEVLVKAETLSSLALILGAAYPGRALKEAWQLLLFQQFHDTLAGTARKEARDDACDDLRRCISVGREAIGGALQAICAAIDTRGDGAPLLLINPCGTPYEGVLDADLYWRTKHPLRLKDAAGNEIPYDFSRRDLVSPDSRKHLVFRASIPAMGYAVYRLLPEAPQISGEKMACAPLTLENRFLRVAFDSRTGCPASFLDKRTGREYLAGPASLAVYPDERDTWGAKGEIGPRKGEYACLKVLPLEEGCVRSSLLTRLEYGRSEASLIWSLGAEDAFLTLEARLDNREKRAMTTLRLPFADLFEGVLAEAAYAEQARPYYAPGEKHCLRYCELQGPEVSLLILNQAKSGYRVTEGAYEVIASRSPIHAFGSGEMPREDREYDYCDQGEQRFTLRFMPHGPELNRQQRVRAAIALHRPPEVLHADAHEGPLSLRRASLVTLRGLETAVLHLIKQGEDGGLVFRLQNLSSGPCEGSLCLQGREWPVSLAPHQLLTLLIPPQGACRITDLLELE